MISGGKGRDRRQRSGVDLALGRLGSGDVPCRQEAVREAGDEVGRSVGGGVVAVARALLGLEGWRRKKRRLSVKEEEREKHRSTELEGKTKTKNEKRKNALSA